MLPVGPLMLEHRLIERMIGLMNLELAKIDERNEANLDFLDTAIDFLKTYADKCHHGKEEDILFKVLAQKPLSAGHKKMMDELLEEHITSRKTVAALIESKNKYAGGDKAALKEGAGFIRALVQLYLRHIEKEDKQFFLPVMEYLSQQERDEMLNSFRNFDQNFIHQVYKNIVERW